MKPTILFGPSQARPNGFNKGIVDEFYNNLTKMQTNTALIAVHIFNIDDVFFSSSG